LLAHYFAEVPSEKTPNIEDPVNILLELDSLPLYILS